MNSKWYASIATLGPIGYLAAPGTMATLVGMPIMFGLRQLCTAPFSYEAVIIIGSFASIAIITQSLPYFSNKEDPSQIVLDELIGCLITFWHIALTTQSMIIGFLLFRFFDIAKPGFIKRAEQFTKGWGVVVDDVVAALCANIILRLLL